MANNTQQVRQEIADEVFYGIPPDKQRKKMSPRELARLLSECEEGTPKFILIDHELNIRIAKEQNKPQYIAVAMAFIGIILGWILSQWNPFVSPTSLDIIAEHIESKMNADSNDLPQHKMVMPLKPGIPQ